MKCSLLWLGLVIFGLSLVAPSACENDKEASVAYVKASLPNQIYRCVQKFNLLRCLKYFVLLRLESRDHNIPETEKSTSEFLGNILKNEQSLPHEIPEELLSLEEDALNKRLTEGFQRFFKNRPIMLRFIPNVLVKIVPSKSNDLEFSLKRFEEKDFSSRATKDSEEMYDDDDSNEDSKENSKEDKDKEKEEMKDDVKDSDKPSDKGMRKKSTYLQFGIPIAIAPAMIFAGFLPMLIPVLKLATAFTFLVNFSALLGAIFYLARQQALEKEVQSTVYFNPGYKERQF
jgi:hypothetical protein